VNKHLYLCHLLVLSSPTLMMHGHTDLKFRIFLNMNLYHCNIQSCDSVSSDPASLGEFLTALRRLLMPLSSRIKQSEKISCGSLDEGSKISRNIGEIRRTVTTQQTRTLRDDAVKVSGLP